MTELAVAAGSAPRHVVAHLIDGSEKLIVGWNLERKALGSIAAIVAAAVDRVVWV